MEEDRLGKLNGKLDILRARIELYLEREGYVSNEKTRKNVAVLCAKLAGDLFFSEWVNHENEITKIKKQLNEKKEGKK